MEKIILIPGWLNGPKMYGNDYSVLEIWKNKIGPETETSADIMIAHSIGCNWAILNYRKEGYMRLILVNPLIPKRNIFVWLFRWIKFTLSAFRLKNKEIVKGPSQILFAIKQCFRLFSQDVLNKLENISRDRLIVVRGKEDNFFCDEETHEYLIKNNIKTVEVDGCHDWDKNIKSAVAKLTEAI